VIVERVVPGANRTVDASEPQRDIAQLLRDPRALS